MELLQALAGHLPHPILADGEELSVVDGKRLTELIQTIGNPMALTLIRRLTEEAERTVARLMSLSPDADGAEMARLCHQLAGTSGTFGTRQLRAVLVAVETALDRGDPDAATRALGDVPDVWAATRQLLLAEVDRLQAAA